MQRIVAIGGGSLAQRETVDIDREIVRLASKKHPRVLFVPTASYDRLEYWHEFREIYGRTLGCKTDVLWLIRESPARAEIARRISAADVVYVGGGNTLKMMTLWRRLGVDRHMKAAWRRGTVLAGTSAGANCWFTWGWSDSRKFTSPENWQYIRVRGLGFIDAIACPHYHVEHREASFEEAIRSRGGVGIALDNNAALEVVDNRWRIIRARENARAYRLERVRGRVVVEPLDAGDRWIPLDAIFQRSTPADA